MTFTAQQIRLPADVHVPVGQVARFDALGRFLRVEDHVTNGLGLLYRAERDGSFSRYHY